MLHRWFPSLHLWVKLPWPEREAVVEVGRADPRPWTDQLDSQGGKIFNSLNFGVFLLHQPGWYPKSPYDHRQGILLPWVSVSTSVKWGNTRTHQDSEMVHVKPAWGRQAVSALCSHPSTPWLTLCGRHSQVPI